MAQLTLTIIGDVNDVETKVSNLRTNIEKNPIEIKIESTGDTEVLKLQTKLEQARASIARSNAKIAQSERDVKVARQQTKTVTAQTALEEKKAETAKRQSTLETKKAITAEKQRELAIERGNTALKQKELQEERTNTKTAEAEVVEKKLELATERRTESEKKATTGTKELGDATEKTAKKSETLLDNFEKFARWYIIGNVFSSIVRSMKEALQTMKAVDDELVTIRKVTGFTNEQVAGISQQAYENASKYGVWAADYLESVAAFSRAGYKEQAAALAELSTKTQIVGDTTAETANQFLLSVDAAYQYKGSIEELTRVLDGANEIDNKYATSIEKIAEGMGIVAPVAKQVNVGVDELAAAIGTITAVTQRSGSEAARALRALFLNIVGDTKTEIDEGVTWTTGEIAGLQDVIKIYAKDAYDAAKASGEVLNPMEAIAGLAKSMKDGVLTAAELTSMVSDIGGKLRTSQLLAIIQNWDMYQSMLQDYAGAIGSADKEVENALDSWTRKTNQLKNAWAEFVSHLVDSGEIKAGVDLLTGFVKVLDSGVGKAAAFALAVAGIAAAVMKLIPLVKTLNLAFMSSPIFIAGVAAAAVVGVVQLIEKQTKAYDNQLQKMKEVEAEYDRLYGDTGELEYLKSRIGELTEEEVKRLGVLQSQKQELQEQLQIQKELTFDAWRKTQNTTEFEVDPYTGVAAIEKPVNLTERELEGAQQALARLNDEWTTGLQTADNYNNGLKRIVATLEPFAEAIRGGQDAGKELTETEAALLKLYDSLANQIGLYTAGVEKSAQAIEENAEATGKAAEANKALKTAFEEVEKNSSLTYGTLAQLERLYPGLSAKILDANGNLTAEGKAALSTKASFVELISTMIAANTTALNFDGQIAALQNLASEAGIAASMISAVFSSASLTAAGTGDWDDIANMTPDELARYRMSSVSNQTMALLRKQLKDETVIPSGGGGGGGGGGGSSADAVLEAHKSIVALLKQELSFLKESGASQEEQVAKMREIQAALHDQAEYMRSIGADDKEIVALSTEWWNIENQIADIEEEIAKKLREEQLAALKEIVELRQSEFDLLEAQGADYDVQIAKLREIIAALDEQIAEMRRQGASELEINSLLLQRQRLENQILDIQQKQREETIALINEEIRALEAERDARIKALRERIEAIREEHDKLKENTTLAEKRLAVEQALLALENARRERNVRQFNAKTQQWEWVADPKAIEAAEKAWEDAKKAVEEYESELEYQQRIKEIEDQIGEIEAHYEDLKSALQALIDELQNAADSVGDINDEFEKIIEKLSDGDESLYAALKKISQYILSLDISDYDKTTLMKQIENIFSGLSTDMKKQLAGIIDKVFGDPNLPTESKKQIIQKLNDLLGNSSLTSAAKDAIVKGISALVGQGQEIESAVDLMTGFIETALKEAKDPKKAVDDLVKKLEDGTINLGKGINALIDNFKKTGDETARMLLIAQMRKNSLEWFTAGDERKQALHAENMKIGAALGWTYDAATGKWYDQQGRLAYDIGVTGTGTGGGGGGGGNDNTPDNPSNPDTPDDGGGGGGGGGSTGHSTDPKDDNERAYHDTYNSTTKTDSNGRYMAKTYMGDVVTAVQDATNFIKIGDNGDTNVIGGVEYLHGPGQTAWGRYQSDGDLVRYFDRGGLLKGKGGIKATREYEMVIPPGMTRSLMAAENSGAFESFLSHIGIVTAAANSYSVLGGMSARSSIGSQHNGDIYKIGDVTLSEAQARSMTVYDLAQMGKTLALHKGS